MRTDKGKMALLIPTKEPPLNKKAKNDQNRDSRAGRPPTQASCTVIGGNSRFT